VGIATFASGIDALQARLESQGFALLVGSSHYDSDTEVKQIRTLMERGIDGLFLVGHQRRPEIYRQLEEARIPYVCTYTIDHSHGMCVGYDNAAAMRRLVEYLVQLGHRRFGILTSPTHNNDRIAARFKGAVEAIAGFGLGAPEVVEAPYAAGEGRAGLRAIMTRAPSITAVVCTTDLHAIGAVAEARSLGLPVPSRLSITGFDDLDIVADIEPPLTTIHVPSREIGERVAEMLLASIFGRPTMQVVELTASIVVRASTARAPDV
jgi:LacI family transcriptional regulator